MPVGLQFKSKSCRFSFIISSNHQTYYCHDSAKKWTNQLKTLICGALSVKLKKNLVLTFKTKKLKVFVCVVMAGDCHQLKLHPSAKYCFSYKKHPWLHVSSMDKPQRKHSSLIWIVSQLAKVITLGRLFQMNILLWLLWLRLKIVMVIFNWIYFLSYLL